MVRTTCYSSVMITCVCHHPRFALMQRDSEIRLETDQRIKEDLVNPTAEKKQGQQVVEDVGSRHVSNICFDPSTRALQYSNLPCSSTSSLA